MAGLAEGRIDRGAQQRDEDDVVEMSGLERRVLAVVREAENLAVEFVGDARARVMHPFEDRGDEHGRRGAAALRRQRGEPVDVRALGKGQFAACGAEPEFLRLEPAFDAAGRRDLARRQDPDAFVLQLAVRRNETDVAVLGALGPRLGVVGVVAVELDRLGRNRHEEAEPAIVVALVVVEREILDGPGLEAPRTAVGAVPDRQVFLPAVVAEMQGVEPLVSVAFGKEDLGVEHDLPDAVGLDRRVRAARAGDELVQAHAEERLVAAPAGALLLGPAGDEKQGLQRLLAVPFVDT